MGDIDDIGERFLFDTNFFDERAEEEEDSDLPPPPPTFSEEELAAAKKQAFADGKAEGRQEMENSIQQAVSKTLAQINQAGTTLFNAEAQRVKRYEQEAVHLCVHIFKSLFPHYEAKYGFDELEQFLTDTLKKHRGKDTIKIYVRDEYVEGVNTSLQTLSATQPELYYEVIGDAALEGTACRLSWHEGGAAYTPSRIAQEVEEILQQTLAQDGYTRHDETDAALIDEPEDEQTSAAKHDIVDQTRVDEETISSPDAGETKEDQPDE